MLQNATGSCLQQLGNDCVIKIFVAHPIKKTLPCQPNKPISDIKHVLFCTKSCSVKAELNGEAG